MQEFRPLLREFQVFLKTNKKLWLGPIILFALLLIGLIFISFPDETFNYFQFK